MIWKPETVLPFHPNGMLYEALKGGKVEEAWTIFSVGGGALANEHTKQRKPVDIYPLTTIEEILKWCQAEGKTFWEYVEDYEGHDIWEFLSTIWTTMCETIERGLNNEGVLPGGLKVRREASTYMVKAKSFNDSLSSPSKLYAYALATSEENAAGGCRGDGSDMRFESGVVPASALPDDRPKPRNTDGTDTARTRNGRPLRKYRQNQRIHLRGRGGRVPRERWG